MAKENKEVTVKGNTEVSTHVETRRGFEGVDTTSIRIPTAKLLQSNSPEVTDDAYADLGLRAGMLVHSLLLDKVPETIIPISIKDQNTFMSPRTDALKAEAKARVRERFGIELTEDDFKGLFICRAVDGKHGDRFGNCANCKLNQFRGNDKPVCTASINVLALFQQDDEIDMLPLVVRFSNTSYKHGNKMKNLAFYSGGDVFSRKYKLAPTKMTADGNSWYELNIKPAGKTNPEEFEIAEIIYDRFSQLNIEEDDGAPQDGEFVETTEF